MLLFILSAMILRTGGQRALGLGLEMQVVESRWSGGLPYLSFFGEDAAQPMRVRIRV